ncbi:MAG: hypothetical protein E7680_06930 [Ruminococcaceae bacterium]|nr:hypothetical protein [Oscillospiraceae bacterium]
MPQSKEWKFSKWIALEAIGILLIPFFFALVWIPVYHTISGDVLMQDSPFLLIWDFLKDGLIYLFYWLSIAFLSVSLLWFGWIGSLPLFGLYLFGSVIRSIGTALSSAIILQTFDSNLLENIGYAALDVLFDIFLMAAFCLIVYLTAMRKRDLQARKALLPPAKKGFRPIALHLSVLISIAVYYAIRLFERIRYDVFYGAPTGGGDLAWMIFYYLADILLAVFGYFAVILILKLITKQKAKQ